MGVVGWLREGEGEWGVRREGEGEWRGRTDNGGWEGGEGEWEAEDEVWGAGMERGREVGVGREEEWD